MITKDKIYRKLIQVVFHLEEWHRFPLIERPYAIDMITYCNSLKVRDQYAEIGCGLGDILRRVNYKKRTGLDNDRNVLKAARFFRVYHGTRKDVQFKLFRFPQSTLEGTYDVLALVNWIHHIEPTVLKEKLGQYFQSNLRPGGELIIDTVQDKDYRFNHKIEDVTLGLNCKVHRIGSYARERELWSIKKLN